MSEKIKVNTRIWYFNVFNKCFFPRIYRASAWKIQICATFGERVTFNFPTSDEGLSLNINVSVPLSFPLLIRVWVTGATQPAPEEHPGILGLGREV